ncbi:MAG: A/G-specific adenine glycosylase [Chloroflexi bacterium]|nr:A/G-specific adenine glycosylase [Chloroflexota bacterium]
MTLPPPRFPSEALLRWYAGHARNLPWRESADPYAVWVSEIMLHQTRVDTALPYYRRFLARFPDVHTLAAADLSDILKLWEGLGYYRRAQNLHRAAQIVVARHGGAFPASWEALRALPGVGDYTAGAILSIAFGQDCPAVDGNAARVLARWAALEEPIDTARGLAAVRRWAQQALPLGRAGAFNQALMDLGAAVCRPRKPPCEACPLGATCSARLAGRQGELPRRTPRRGTPHYQVTAALLVREGQLLIAQRPAESMLGGLWEFPGGKQEEGETLPQCLQREILEELALEIAVGEPFMALDHAYTHFRITLHTFWCTLLRADQTPRCQGCNDWRWVQPEQLVAFPLSAADRRIANALQRAQRLTDQVE